MMRNIMLDYEASKEVTPYEYMMAYIEKCPDNMEDHKISWIVETFLGLEKHFKFLKNMAGHISEKLTDEDQQYFMVVFYAVIFEVSPTDMTLLYKCLYNLSKPLLSTFTQFLSNNEVLTFISQVAQADYDSSFITEKIIGPLFTWQPYISEMAHTYAQFVKKIESRKLKLPTIPVQPNVLNRKGKEPHLIPLPAATNVTPATPPNSLRNKGRRMLTKSAIDNKLKKVHENNKQKASHLLHSVKTNDCHYAQGKSQKYYSKISKLKEEGEQNREKIFVKKNTSKCESNSVPFIKDTTAYVKRINMRIQMSEQDEIQWLEDLVVNCRNTSKIEELEEFDRQERERERLLDVERKHIMGQMSYEEAVIAKKKLIDDNKKKYEEFLKEKKKWEDEIERWKKYEIERNRKQVEKLSLMELDMLHARHNATVRKKEMAEKLRKDSEEMLSKALKKKQEELDRRIKMIKEIKVLALIAKKVKVPKIIDLTESSGLGLLCEMSMAELRERLTLFKIEIKEELEKKRKFIKEDNLAAKKDLEETKKSIINYMAEREYIRKQKQKNKSNVNPSSSKEINELKKLLEEKRNLRIKLTS